MKLKVKSHVEKLPVLGLSPMVQICIQREEPFDKLHANIVLFFCQEGTNLVKMQNGFIESTNAPQHGLVNLSLCMQSFLEHSFKTGHEVLCFSSPSLQAWKSLVWT